MNVTLLCIYPSYFNATGLCGAIEKHCGHTVTQFVSSKVQDKLTYSWPLHHRNCHLQDIDRLNKEMAKSDLVIVCGAMVLLGWQLMSMKPEFKDFTYSSLDDFFSNIPEKTKTAMIISDSAILERDWTKEISRFDAVVAMPDLFDYVRHPNLFPALQVNHRFKEPRTPGTKVVIGHSPGNKKELDRKGTRSIGEVLDAVKSKGYDFEYRILANLSNAECIREKQKMDIFIDQLQDPQVIPVGEGMKPFLGALGKSGQEGMCNGCATITSGNLVSNEPYFPNPPIIIANTKAILEYEVEKLLRIPQYRYRKAVEQFNWAREYLRPQFVSQYIMGKLTGQKQSATRAFTKFVKQYILSKSLWGVEVGVQKGDNALDMLRELPISPRGVLVLVDIWDEYQIANKDGEGFTTANFNHHYPEVLRRFGDNSAVVIRKNLSVRASKSYCDEVFDFVYIDACHSYEAVTEDIKAWFPKVKPGGVIGGHDYNGSLYPGLRRAVDEFVKEGNYKLYQEASDWWVVK
ncbi:MAG: class I SAM-dependent methyltransferase [Planctomycetota bacterium]|jgi:hypothetical protein